MEDYVDILDNLKRCNIENTNELDVPDSQIGVRQVVRTEYIESNSENTVTCFSVIIISR